MMRMTGAAPGAGVELRASVQMCASPHACCAGELVGMSCQVIGHGTASHFMCVDC